MRAPATVYDPGGHERHPCIQGRLGDQETVGKVRELKSRSAASACSARMAMNARSISVISRTSRGRIVTSSDLAASIARSSCNLLSVLLEVQRTAMRVAAGSALFSNSSRLAASSTAKSVSPVTFPPGRARLFTRPISTGSPPPTKTMGIVFVAFAAARAALGPTAKMISTPERTSSAASIGRCSLLPLRNGAQ